MGLLVLAFLRLQALVNAPAPFLVGFQSGFLVGPQPLPQLPVSLLVVPGFPVPSAGAGRAGPRVGDAGGGVGTQEP